VWYLGTYIQEYHCLQMRRLKTNCLGKTATIVVNNYLKHIYLLMRDVLRWNLKPNNMMLYTKCCH